MEPRLIIVVGTTPDYVIKIQEEERIKPLLFLLDLKFKDYVGLSVTGNSDLMFSDLKNYDETLGILNKYISKKDVKPCIACFDCEALHLAARIAEHLGCRFPAPDAVLKSRNKFLSGRLWIKNHVMTPECGLASTLAESLLCFNKYRKNIVLKPLTGSGSELVFHCTEEQDVISAVNVLQTQLKNRSDNPLFTLITDPLSGKMIDPCSLWIVEEYIDGTEYSCDFFMDMNNTYIMRETEKIKDGIYPFGTISGYIIPPSYPDTKTTDKIKSAMKNAASALGFAWGYFMADFIIRDGQIIMIELTPRPGGDSIPELIKAATGTDIIKAYIDIIAGDTSTLENPPKPSGSFASVHLFSARKGVIEDIDTSEITGDPRTRLLLLKKNKGDAVSLPPDDYDNRLIGYCVVSRNTNDSSLEICKEIQQKIKIKYSDLN